MRARLSFKDTFFLFISFIHFKVQTLEVIVGNKMLHGSQKSVTYFLNTCINGMWQLVFNSTYFKPKCHNFEYILTNFFGGEITKNQHNFNLNSLCIYTVQEKSCSLDANFENDYLDFYFFVFSVRKKRSNRNFINKKRKDLLEEILWPAAVLDFALKDFPDPKVVL